MKILFFHFLSMSLILFVGCTKKTDQKTELPSPLPEEVVKKFILLSGQAQEISDKDKLTDLCSGEMKKAFQDMSPDQFRLYYLNDNLTVQDFKVLSSSKTQNQAKIFYQVMIENRQGTDVTKEVNEREVDLVETPQGWLIESIRPSGTDRLIFTKGMVF